MEDIVQFSLYDILTSENVISVKRKSPATWSHFINSVLTKKNKIVLSQGELHRKCQFLANFFRRNSRKRTIKSLVEEHKRNFCDQIVTAREISTIDGLIFKFDNISFQEEEDSGTVVCRLCEEEEILVTKKFCRSCLDTAIEEAIENMNEKMKKKQLNPSRKRKLSVSFENNDRESGPQDSSFLPLKPEYKIPKQEIQISDDQDYQYITAFRNIL